MILVLGCRGASTWMLVRELQRNFADVRVIIENKEATGKFVRRRIRRLGAIETIGQIAFVIYGKFAGARARAAARICILRAGFDDSPLADDQIIAVESVNDRTVRNQIASLRPRVVVVSGTRIIGSGTLAATDAKFINAHYGITPMYRGVHGGYWALAQGDVAHCGVTVHLVDRGVDTGEVIAQEIISPGRRDNFFTLPVRQAIVATPLIVDAVRDCLEGRLATRAAAGPSRQWYHPTLWGYIWTGLRRGVW